MRHPLAPNFRRFLPAWLAFGSSVGLAVFVLAMPASLWELLEPSGEIDDMPPMLVVLLSVFAYLAALVTGLFVVPWRRLIVGPRFPFVRRGYLVVAALPSIFIVLPGLLWIQRAYLVAAVEVLFALSALFFVGFGRWFGAFDEEERSP